MRERSFRLVSVLLAAAVMFMPRLAYADDDEDGTVYLLTYPNGEVVTTTDRQEAERLTDEWKVIFSGTTDSEGKIVLEGWVQSGEILIKGFFTETCGIE